MLSENASVPADRRVWNQALALRRAGFDVVIVAPNAEVRDREPFELRDGIEIHRFAHAESSGGAAGYAREYALAMRDIRRHVRRLARGRSFDVVHACNPPDLLLLAALPLKAGGARFVFDHHDLVPELCRERFGGRGGEAVYRAALACERLTFELADVVISTNESFRRVALERGRKQPEDVFVVRNGPALDRFRPTAPDPELKRGRRHLIAYLGMMGLQDGIDHALRALSLLHDRDDWQAVFMGEGDMLDPMRRLAAELGFNGRVVFTGWMDDGDVRRVLSSSDVCLAPDPKTPLNDRSTMVKIAEYMALSRPVVSYDLTESRFTAGAAAAYAKPGDVEGFAQCIAQLLDDPDRRAAMGGLGRERVESALAWEHSERSLYSAYARVLGLETLGPAD